MPESRAAKLSGSFLSNVGDESVQVSEARYRRNMESPLSLWFFTFRLLQPAKLPDHSLLY